MKKTIILILVLVLVGCNKPTDIENCSNIGIGIPLKNEAVKEMSKIACSIGCLTLMEELTDEIEINNTRVIEILQKCETKCRLYDWGGKE